MFGGVFAPDTGALVLHHGQLLSKSQVLGCQIASTTYGGSYSSKNNSQPLKHVSRLSDHSEKKQQNQAGPINGRDK